MEQAAATKAAQPAAKSAAPAPGAKGGEQKARRRRVPVPGAPKGLDRIATARSQWFEGTLDLDVGGKTSPHKALVIHFYRRIKKNGKRGKADFGSVTLRLDDAGTKVAGVSVKGIHEFLQARLDKAEAKEKEDEEEENGDEEDDEEEEEA